MPEPVDIASIPLASPIDVLSPENIDRLHDDTLEVLERVGVQIEPGAVLTALAESDAEVDAGAGRVWLSRTMIEQALSHPRCALTLAARDRRQDLHLSGDNGYLAVDGCAAEILDFESGMKRASTKQDLATVTRVADALPEIGFTWQAVAARDTPIAVKPLHELQVQLANTSKHIQMMTCVTAQAAEGVVEIARTVAGGAQALKKRPIVSAFQCSLSPLKYEGGALEAALVFARAGVPCGFVVMPISCATAPATPFGTLVVANAEVLAGFVILETLVPGAATFYGSCATAMDLYTGAAACGGPEDLLYQMASAQLARYYGVPALVGTFATGSKAPDWQAGVENGLSGLASCLGGADMFCGAGLLFGASVFSLEQMVLDTEIFRMLRALLSPLVLAPDQSTVELIHAVGPGGHFLDRDHTLENMRRFWLPRFFDREGWPDREPVSTSRPAASARERISEILASHHPAPLAGAVAEDIDRIVKEYEQRPELTMHGGIG